MREGVQNEGITAKSSEAMDEELCRVVGWGRTFSGVLIQEYGWQNRADLGDKPI